MGYHLKEIERGIYGEISKIREEMDELMDAVEQQSKVLILVELCDYYGALKEYCKNNDIEMKSIYSLFEGNLFDTCRKLNKLTKQLEDSDIGNRKEIVSMILSIMDDISSFYDLEVSEIIDFSEITKRAFESGRRS